MATGDSPPRIPPRDRRKTRRGGIPHVQQRQENPGPHSGNQEATSSKSTARHSAEMLRKSSRQQADTGGRFTDGASQVRQSKRGSFIASRVGFGTKRPAVRLARRVTA